ncbi:DUF4013 domain-containing protein [Methanobrevibacter sp.]
MEIIDIVKDSFMFPTKNLKALVLYMVIMIACFACVAVGVVFAIFAFADSIAYLAGTLIFAIIAVLILFILLGYSIDIIKTGIDLQDEAPDFDWQNDLIKGIKAVIVDIVYFIIPAILTLFVAIVTNVPGNIIHMVNELNKTAVSTNGTVVASSLEMIPTYFITHLLGSVVTTVVVALLLFIIFSFIQYAANARLANTGSLSKALNFIEAFKDISKMGFGKVIATVVLMILITFAINAVLAYVYQQVSYLAILDIIVIPFFIFVDSRANGLLFSDMD